MPTATRSAAGSLAPAPRPCVGTSTTKSLRLVACTLAVAAAALMAPGAAVAGTNQLSLIQDDRELLGFAPHDPGAAMSEIAELGVDIVRTNTIYNKVYRKPRERTKPAGFDASDPDSPEYDWSRTDRLVTEARANGLQILMTVTGPGPHFTTGKPNSCGRVTQCTNNPIPGEFGKFAAAVAKRYRGKVSYYSLYNEPNLHTWITPQQTRPGPGRFQVDAAIYRKLWIAGYRSIARFDPARRNRVLFGEVAAIGEPLPLLYGALCLDLNGNPFRGKLARRQGCAGRPAKLNVGGFAIHPYNFGGYGTPQSKTRSRTGLPLAYLPRLHRLIDRAKRLGRITRRAPISVTEFGFQTRPPDPSGSAATLAKHAQYINESDRLFYSDPRVNMVAQYELSDEPSAEVFNSGLRFAAEDGRRTKPAYEAYRVPIVVTRRSANSVEVYGQVRPGGSASVQIQSANGGGTFTAVQTVSTNSRGVFKVNVNRSGAAGRQWRLATSIPSGLITSRVAKAGKALRYYRN